ncbi:hypothetical protein FO440_15225 [Mucilaginibacter corticis]|uniref:Uncharacterized protein n=1 Tax=Mucilaginibacter corticis TaxID=2597670 RepID=A0A556MMP5_9SPHI|nr:hypothetical protein [Mucilaginibacter corticis]TSJ41078.1 hypothetical protein FO440_15225 [Mucilaginibacter corticis]
MMNSDHFNALGYLEKTEVVLTGTFLADRITEDHYVRLYNVDQFYVEVFFNRTSRLIADFRAFEHTMFVLPYLDDLKVAV